MGAAALASSRQKALVSLVARHGNYARGRQRLRCRLRAADPTGTGFVSLEAVVAALADAGVPNAERELSKLISANNDGAGVRSSTAVLALSAFWAYLERGELPPHGSLLAGQPPFKNVAAATTQHRAELLDAALQQLEDVARLVELGGVIMPDAVRAIKDMIREAITPDSCPHSPEVNHDDGRGQEERTDAQTAGATHDAAAAARTAPPSRRKPEASMETTVAAAGASFEPATAATGAAGAEELAATAKAAAPSEAAPAAAAAAATMTEALNAARCGDVGTLRALAAAAACDLRNADPSFGRSPLYYASLCGHVPAVRFLLEEVYGGLAAVPVGELWECKKNALNADVKMLLSDGDSRKGGGGKRGRKRGSSGGDGGKDGNGGGGSGGGGGSKNDGRKVGRKGEKGGRESKAGVIQRVETQPAVASATEAVASAGAAD